MVTVTRVGSGVVCLASWFDWGLRVPSRQLLRLLSRLRVVSGQLLRLPQCFAWSVLTLSVFGG